MVEALKPGVEMTRAKILKRKKDLSDLQIFLFYIKRVDPLPRSAKGAGVWGLRRPKGFFVLFWLQKRTPKAKRTQIDFAAYYALEQKN